jgi:aminopeptidase N
MFPIWRSDPVSFWGYPPFFLAHEVAHQWWGQGVGWESYHEQWLSEGFAQYFAALYAEADEGPAVFGDILDQMRTWALDRSDQGPVYLGYRLGHVKRDSRTFRALVYNKGAVVLHMLRRLVGDDAFFRGLRRFYEGARYVKTGTEDLRDAMEIESGRSLQRFFDRWIHGSTLPQLTYAYDVRSSPVNEVAVRIEQSGDLFDIPVTVTLEFRDRSTRDVVISVTEARVDVRIPLEGPLRSLRVSERDGTLARARRTSY